MVGVLNDLWHNFMDFWHEYQVFIHFVNIREAVLRFAYQRCSLSLLCKQITEIIEEAFINNMINNAVLKRVILFSFFELLL